MNNEIAIQDKQAMAKTGKSYKQKRGVILWRKRRNLGWVILNKRSLKGSKSSRW